MVVGLGVENRRMGFGQKDGITMGEGGTEAQFLFITWKISLTW